MQRTRLEHVILQRIIPGKPQGPDEFFHVPIYMQWYELGSNQNLGMSCLTE
jgi:hypothetical protein